MVRSGDYSLKITTKETSMKIIQKKGRIKLKKIRNEKEAFRIGLETFNSIAI